MASIVKSIKDFFNRSRHRLITVTLLSAVFGLGAGIVGMLLAVAYLLPAPLLTGAAPQGRSGQIVQVADRPTGAVLIAGKAQALFFAVKTGAAAQDRSYVPGEALAAGVVLTSDGWLLSYGEAAKSRSAPPPAGFDPGKQPTIAVIGGKSYPVGSIIRDPFTNVVFLKVDASNLPVTPFDGTADLSPAMALYGFDAGRGVRQVNVIDLSDRPYASTDELLLSTERLQKVLRVEADDLLPGSMLINAKGQVTGIFAKAAGFGSYAVPANAFFRQVATVLRDKAPQRPYLGLRYLDLTALTDAAAEKGASRGALIAGSSDGRLAAVAKGSPAEAAGLSRGDLIVAVAGEELTARNGLADLLAEYAPKTELALTVRRDGKDTLVKITLGAAAP